MKNKIITFLAATLAAVGIAGAGTTFFQDPPPLEKPISLSEVSLKTFAFYNNVSEADFGAGVGVDYEFNPNIAVGIEGAWLPDGGESGFDGSVGVNFYFKPESNLPFGLEWYSVTSAGVVFRDEVDPYLRAGFGLEKQLFNNVSLYTEANYTFILGDSDYDFLGANLGIRFTF